MEMRLKYGGRGQIVAGISRSSANAKRRKFIKWDLLNHLSDINSKSKLRRMKVLVSKWSSRSPGGGVGGGELRVFARGPALLQVG